MLIVERTVETAVRSTGSLTICPTSRIPRSGIRERSGRRESIPGRSPSEHRFHNVSQFRGRETELEYRLTRLEPVRRLTFVGENKTVTSTDDMRLTSTATGTAIHYQARFAFKGVAKLASPFLRSSIREAGR